MAELVLMSLASLAVAVGGLAAILAAARPDPPANPPAPPEPHQAPPPELPALPRPCDRPVYRLAYHGGPCDGLLRKTCRLPGDGEWREGGWYEPIESGAGEVVMVFVRHRARAET